MGPAKTTGPPRSSPSLDRVVFGLRLAQGSLLSGRDPRFPRQARLPSVGFGLGPFLKKIACGLNICDLVIIERHVHTTIEEHRVS